MKFNLGKHIEPYPDLFEIVQNKGLSINYKVKLKSYAFAIEPIVYFRVCNWKVTHHSLEDIFFLTDLDRELSCLEKVREVYSVYLQKYESLDLNLSDPSLSYHSYFAAVYNLSQKKILTFQL